MKLELECTARDYRVAIKDDDFTALTHAEDKYLVAYEDFLHLKIDNIPGVSDTEYNGHFGSMIYFRVLAEDVSEETHQAILDTIRKHIAVCKRKYKQQKVAA